MTKTFTYETDNSAIEAQIELKEEGLTISEVYELDNLNVLSKVTNPVRLKQIHRDIEILLETTELSEEGGVSWLNPEDV